MEEAVSKPIVNEIEDGYIVTNCLNKKDAADAITLFEVNDCGLNKQDLTFRKGGFYKPDDIKETFASITETDEGEYYKLDDLNGDTRCFYIYL